MSSTPVMSVVYGEPNDALIAKHVRPLWIRSDDLVMDVTYGEGNWWTLWRPERFVAHDLYKLDGVDFRRLPEPDGSVDVIAFDPPYIAQGGRETSTVPEMLGRYGLNEVPISWKGTAELIADGITECARVLSRGGRLLVKCMDYINGGRYQTGRHGVVEAALTAGLEQVDEFIHVTGAGPQPQFNRDGTPRRQLHSRRAHSFLCVFAKDAAAYAGPEWQAMRYSPGELFDVPAVELAVDVVPSL